MAFGDIPTALSISIIYELLWLDLIPAGTFIPPNSAAANIACLTLMTFFGWSTAAEAVLPLILCLPLAGLGAKLESLLRNRQNREYDALLRWEGEPRTSDVRIDEYAPFKLIRRSMTRAFVIHFVMFLVCTVFLIAVLSMLQEAGATAVAPDQLDWRYLWPAAAIGGLLSLRAARAYTTLAGLVCAMAALLFYLSLGPSFLQ